MTMHSPASGYVTARRKATVSSKVTGKVVEACRVYLGQNPVVVDAGIKTGVRIRYEDPRAVGADRIVDAAAVQRLYGGPACVVDFGTATTFDAISARGEYLGGVICPGVTISADALFQHAARLPRVDVRKPPAVVGRTTVHSMQSGLFFGYVGLVEGVVERMRAELGGPVATVATGGLAEMIAPETPAIDEVDRDLTLFGLRVIWERNRKAKS